MHPKTNPTTSRRNFLGSVTGLMTGFLALGSGNANASKSEIRQFINDLEIDTLIRSTPKQTPHVICRKKDGRHVLFNEKHPKRLLGLNDTGRLVWDRCDGNQSPGEISRYIHQRYRIDFHQAYLDCLCFLALLKRNGFIHL